MTTKHPLFLNDHERKQKGESRMIKIEKLSYKTHNILFFFQKLNIYSKYGFTYLKVRTKPQKNCTKLINRNLTQGNDTIASEVDVCITIPIIIPYIIYYIKNKSDVLTKLVPQGNIAVVHRSTHVMFHVCPKKKTNKKTTR
jgi:hypothetical protein